MSIDLLFSAFVNSDIQSVFIHCLQRNSSPVGGARDISILVQQVDRESGLIAGGMIHGRQGQQMGEMKSLEKHNGN